jgi:hypothetical protein
MAEELERDGRQRNPLADVALPWVERTARDYLRYGPGPIGFAEFSRDEQLVVLRMVGERPPSRPRPRRRAA